MLSCICVKTVGIHCLGHADQAVDIPSSGVNLRPCARCVARSLRAVLCLHLYTCTEGRMPMMIIIIVTMLHRSCGRFPSTWEAVAILPQLVLLQRTQNIDNLTGNYVFMLGCARRRTLCQNGAKNPFDASLPCCLPLSHSRDSFLADVVL